MVAYYYLFGISFKLLYKEKWEIWPGGKEKFVGKNVVNSSFENKFRCLSAGRNCNDLNKRNHDTCVLLVRSSSGM